MTRDTTTRPPLVLFQYIGARRGNAHVFNREKTFRPAEPATEREKGRIHHPYFGNGSKTDPKYKEQQLRWLELSKIP